MSTIKVEVCKTDLPHLWQTVYDFRIQKKPEQHLKFKPDFVYDGIAFQATSQIVPGWLLKINVAANDDACENKQTLLYQFAHELKKSGLEEKDFTEVMTQVKTIIFDSELKVTGAGWKNVGHTTQLDWAGPYPTEVNTEDGWYAAGQQIEYYGNSSGMIISKTPSEFSKLSNELPAVNETVEYPCEHGLSPHGPAATLKDVIMHLNDAERWSREKIADWLDELHDSGKVNIEF